MGHSTGAPTPIGSPGSRPLLRPEHRPRMAAGYLFGPEVYELPALLSQEECEQVIDAINGSLQPSTVTRGSTITAPVVPVLAPEQSPAGGEPGSAHGLVRRGSAPLGTDSGQRYTPANTSRNTDWFASGTQNTPPTPTRRPTHLDGDGLSQCCGQGEGTLFRRLGRSFTLYLVWRWPGTTFRPMELIPSRCMRLCRWRRATNG